jgi:Core-2/I-Branching enzyme
VGRRVEGDSPLGKICVVVLSHRYPAQVERLLGALSHGADTFVVVHHDPSGEPLTNRFPSNAVPVPGAAPCSWGRWSVVEALLRSMAFARIVVPDLAWLVVVSGLDYPIHGMQFIERELHAATVDGYVRHFSIGDPADDSVGWQEQCRRRYLHSRRLPFTYHGAPVPRERRHPFHDGTVLHVGDLWMNLSGRAVGKVLDSPLRAPIARYLRTVPIPDEAFVPSMLFNEPPELTVVGDSRRFIQWPDFPSPHPRSLVSEDLPALRASTAFFARKIDPVRHPDVCAQLDELAEQAGHI